MLSKRRGCVNDPDICCYTCGSFVPSVQRQNITPLVKNVYYTYFGIKLSYYKKYSNLLTRIKERSKFLHYQNILNDVKHDSCGTWRVIKELLAASPKRSPNHSISLLETDGENLSNAKDIANTLNNYFSTIGEKLAKTIKKHDLLSYTHYLMTRISSSFF